MQVIFMKYLKKKTIINNMYYIMNINNRILDALKKRLQKFSLELAEDKTKIIRLNRKGKDDENHDKQVKSFNFLGFTHFCDKTRKGNFKLGRTTDKKKFSTKLKEWNKAI